MAAIGIAGSTFWALAVYVCTVQGGGIHINMYHVLLRCMVLAAFGLVGALVLGRARFGQLA
jgi:hypothetical protein